MNKIVLSGRYVRDPEIRWSQGEKPTAVARFTLAVDRKFKRDGEPSADFISCIAFGKTAEVIEKHCFKGTKVIVEGRWQTGSYTNKDGNKVYTNDCLAESIEFCESKNANGGNQAPVQQKPADDSFMNVPDIGSDELPFH
jgi:single-strand DNA-binding protein